MDEMTAATENQKETKEQIPWYKTITLKDAKIFIQANITSAARNFISIGYYLKHIRDNKFFLEDGHSTLWDFAQAEFGISKSTASRYMTMNDRFSKDGNSPTLNERYKEFDKSKLQEMLSLTDEQVELVTPEMKVQEIRSMRMPKETPYFELEGQMEFESDFPEILPEEVPEQFSENTYPIQQQPQSFMLNVSDLLQAPEKTIAISQQPETHQVETHDKTEEEPEAALENEKPAEIVDGEFTEIYEPESENLTDLQIAQEELNRAKNLLVKCLAALPDENDIHIRGMKIKVAALASLVCDMDDIENHPPKPKQPELPILKNNDQRAAFVDAYETWPLWIETKETGERYYRYDLADEISLVVKVYHAMLFNYKAYGANYEERFSEGYGKHEYYLLQEGKFFKDCETNRSQLIEKLKEIQKKGNG